MSLAGRIGPTSKPTTLGSASLLNAMLAALVGWPFALWSAHRARRRLRSYGPPAVLALRPARGRPL